MGCIKWDMIVPSFNFQNFKQILHYISSICLCYMISVFPYINIKKKIKNMGQGMTIKAQGKDGPKNPKAHEVERVKE